MSLLPDKIRDEIQRKWDTVTSFGQIGKELKSYSEKNLSGDEQDLFRYIAAYLPYSDLFFKSLPETVRHSLMLLETVPYCQSIPVELFLTWVVYPRVNNEALTSHRPGFYKELKGRIAGKTLAEAAIEVNYWCLEKAVYHPSDDRTLPPDAVIRRGFGRCGEESTLAVEAMRSVGIPARQCYAPRWAHCDDNHAWVEVWTGDGWHFLGACEPQPRLDSAWFVSAASKAPLIHTRAFSGFPFEEEVLERDSICQTLNRTPCYADCRGYSVRVLDGGRPAEGARVRFEILNYAELFPVCTLTADAEGTVFASLGKGDFHLHITSGDRVLNRMLRREEDPCCELDLSEASGIPDKPVRIEMRPPAGRIPPEEPFAEKEQEQHQKRFAHCAACRAEFEKTLYLSNPSDGGIFDPYLVKSRGNWRAVLQFVQDRQISAEDKKALFDGLPEKDLADTPYEVLKDALAFRDRGLHPEPQEIRNSCLLNPRCALEPLEASRGFLASFFTGKETAPALYSWLRKQVRTADLPVFGGLTVGSGSALRYRLADRDSWTALLIACCRAAGIPARFSPVDGKAEYWDQGRFYPFEGDGETASLTLLTDGKREILFGEQLSAARLERGGWRPVHLPGTGNPVSLRPGTYRIITVSRQIDGTQFAHIYHISLHDGEHKTLAVTRPEDDTARRLLQADLPELPGDPKRSSVYAFVSPGEEPTEHLLNELIDLQEEFSQIPVILAVPFPESLRHPAIHRVLGTLSGSQAVFCPPEKIPQIRSVMAVGDHRLPLAMAIGKDGRGLWAFANYQVGTARALLDILASEAKERYMD